MEAGFFNAGIQSRLHHKVVIMLIKMLAELSGFVNSREVTAANVVGQKGNPLNEIGCRLPHIQLQESKLT